MNSLCAMGPTKLDLRGRAHKRCRDFGHTIADVDDATRICGFAPTSSMLRAATPGVGRPLAYAESPEPDGTVVTVAAMVWP